MGASSKMGNIELPEGGEQTEWDARPGFRAGVVGSNPAGPTKMSRI
jgi:hypothetical protein